MAFNADVDFALGGDVDNDAFLEGYDKLEPRG